MERPPCIDPKRGYPYVVLQSYTDEYGNRCYNFVSQHRTEAAANESALNFASKCSTSKFESTILVH
jgi:hypothetical protein